MTADLARIWAVIFFAGMALLAFVRPRAIPGIFGGEAATAPARTEVRAVYGGFGAVAAAILIAQPSWAYGATLALAAILAGMAAARTLGGILERDTKLWPTWVMVVVELLWAGALYLAARGA